MVLVKHFCLIDVTFLLGGALINLDNLNDYTVNIFVLM
jgi:hypothetical protein